jgi:protein-S-isoprenylcysteine O-methyltransferase Ste14
MGPFVVFDAILLIFLIGIVIALARTTRKLLYEKAVISTILIYRIVTCIGIFLGLRFDQLGTSQWRYDHKWLGLTVLASVLLFWPRTKNTTYRTILLGVGTGQMLDEISEFLILAGFHFRPNFRDSWSDLTLILLATVLFFCLKILITLIRTSKVRWDYVLQFYGTVGVPIIYIAGLITIIHGNSISLPDIVRIMSLVMTGIGMLLWVRSYRYLGHSFGVLPQKRKRVTTGLYMYLKHPMYIGIVCTYLGLAIANQSRNGILFTLFILIPLLVIRARSEEKLLTD